MCDSVFKIHFYMFSIKLGGCIMIPQKYGNMVKICSLLKLDYKVQVINFFLIDQHGENMINLVF